jgi:hypothetical protein
MESPWAIPQGEDSRERTESTTQVAGTKSVTGEESFDAKKTAKRLSSE